MPPFEVGDVGIRIDGLLVIETGGRRQLQANLPADVSRKLLLQRENAAQRPLVAAGPEMRLVAPIDQLRVDAHAITLAADTAFHNVVDVQLFGDFPDRRRAVRRPVLHDGGPGDDPERFRAESTDLADHLLGQALGEVRLRRAAAQVFEWQDRYQDSLPSSLPLVMSRRGRLAETPTPAVPPRVKLRFQRVDGAERVVNVAVNGKAFFPLPTHGRANAASQVRGDFLPRLQAVGGCRAFSLRSSFGIAHARRARLT